MIRSDVIRVYKTLHTWTGLFGGMALFICFYAGAFSMFKEPLSRWATPPAQQSDWVAPEQWPELIRATLAQHPEAAGAFTLHVRQQENLPAPLTWATGDERLHIAPQAWASLDADGRLVTGQFQPAPIAELIDLLHQTAGIPGGGHHYLGVYLMGGISILYVLALVSGLIVLLPTLFKDLFALRQGANRKRFWLDAHNLVGLISLPFHLVIALSVIVFAFHDEIYDGLQKLVYQDQPLWERPAADPGPQPVDTLLPPQQLLERLAERAPDFVPRELHYLRADTASAQVRVFGLSPWQPQRDGNRGLATLDAHTGEILDTAYLPGHENRWTAIINSFFALHFGNYGGGLVQWGYLLLGLGGAFLFYSGNLLWIEARRRRQRGNEVPVQKRSTVAMAAATVGVCWGCVAGISCAALAGKWLATSGLNLQNLYMTVYYSVFLLAVLWSFVRGAAAASVHLLWLSAGATLAIPATGLLALCIPALPVWLHLQPELLLIDLGALLFGLAFIHMARRASRHLTRNGPDSVWSNQTRINPAPFPCPHPSVSAADTAPAPRTAPTPIPKPARR